MSQDTIREETGDEALIMTVSQYPVIYDLSHDDYRRTINRERAWRVVSAETGLQLQRCKDRWKSIRDEYRRLKSKEKMKPSGSKGGRTTNWAYWGIIHFLDPYMDPRDSNFLRPTPTAESSQQQASGEPSDFSPAESESSQQSFIQSQPSQGLFGTAAESDRKGEHTGGRGTQEARTVPPKYILPCSAALGASATSTPAAPMLSQLLSVGIRAPTSTSVHCQATANSNLGVPPPAPPVSGPPSSTSASSRRRARNLVGEQEESPQLRQDDAFEQAVMAELHNKPDGTTHFGLYVANELRDLDPQTRMELEIDIMKIIDQAKYRATH